MLKTHHHSIQWTHHTQRNAMIIAATIEICDYAIKHLMSSVLKPKTIQVLLDTPPASEDGTIPLGSCSSHCTDSMIPGLITIIVDPTQSFEDFTDTLFHEFCHAEQQFTGRLGTSRIRNGDNPTIKMWKGRAFSTRLIDYIDWPWEIEAREVAAKLTRDIGPLKQRVEQLVAKHEEDVARAKAKQAEEVAA